MTFLFYLTITLFILVCLFMILLILIQKGRGGGLASAFGGAGGNTAFGSKTGDVLTWATSIVFGIFLLLALALNWMANSRTTTVAAPVRQNTPAVPEPYKPPVPTNPPFASPAAVDPTVPASPTASDLQPVVPTTAPTIAIE